MQYTIPVLVIVIITISHTGAQLKEPIGTSPKISPAKSAVKEAAKEVQENKTEASQSVHDTKIAAEIRKQLAKNPILKTAVMSIEVKEGVVTLKGSVATQDLKNLVTSMSNKVSGVKTLHNNLEVEKKKK